MPTIGPGLGLHTGGPVTMEFGPPSSGAVPSLQEAIHNLLNVREQQEFREIINDYHSRMNLVDLTHSLSIILDTPAKRQISKLLAHVIPRSHVAQFTQLMFGRGVNGAATSNNDTLWESKTLPRRMPRGHPSGSSNLGRNRSNNNVAALSTPLDFQSTTLPLRGTKVIRKPMAHTDFLGSGRSSGPKWEAQTPNRTRLIRLVAPSNSALGLGFSIRGGAEHGIGIYVSYVDVGSIAEKQGLTPGDLILSVNGVSFRKITHDEAARIVKTSKRLDLELRHVGRVPGSFETHQTYSWVNADGRPVTPPPEVDRAGRYETAGTRKSGLMLLKDSDERKINLVVTESKTLGISIRGGNEFGLGLYVTQVDRSSVSENAGLKVGDQILDVNGFSFLDITHADAVKVLKSSKHLMITVKDVGKLPYARTTHDHTQWITGQRLKHPPPHSVDGTEFGLEPPGFVGNFSPAHRPATDSMFTRGAGSQLMHNSMMHQANQLALIEESARQVLHDRERLTLKYYLEEYMSGYITVEALTMALFEMLNTRNKFTLISDIRGVIFPKDIRAFDNLVLHKEVTMLKSKSMDNLLTLSDQRRDSLDMASYSSNSHYGSPLATGPYQQTASEEEMEALKQAIKLIENDRLKEGKTQTKKKSKIKSVLGSLRRPSKKKQSTSQNKLQVSAEIHPDPIRRLIGKDEMRSPSEDSGVDLNGASHTTDTTLSSQQQASISSRGQNGNHLDASLQSYHDNYRHMGGPNAYSLMDTAVQRESSSDHDGLVSSFSEFDESMNRKMNMFKTLPAQFESEMVHANIQTEGDWSHIQSQYPGGSSTMQRGRAGERSKVPTETRSRSLDRLKLRHHKLSQYAAQAQVSPRSRDIIMTSPGQYNRGIDSDDGYDPFDIQANRPPKPPRTQSTHRGSNQNPQSAGQRTERIFEEMSPALYDEGSPSHIPEIRTNKRDFTQHNGARSKNGYHDNHSIYDDAISVGPPSTTTTASVHRSHSNERLWESENSRFTEPLTIVPPPPPSSASMPSSSDSRLSSHSTYELFEMPDVDNSVLSNGIPPPSEHFLGNDLLPIAIVPPPPPLDPDVSPDLKQAWKNEQQRQEAQRRTNPSVTLPPGIDGKIKHLKIVKSRPNLGIAIEGGANTRQPLPRIINIQPAGAAATCPDLKIGDVIVKVNDQKLEGLEHRQCAKIVALAFKDKTKDILNLVVIDVSKKMSL